MSDLPTFYEDLFNNQTTVGLTTLIKQINQYVDERTATELTWAQTTPPCACPPKTPLTYNEEYIWRQYGYYTPGTYDAYLAQVLELYSIESDHLLEVLDFLVLRQRICELLIKLEPLIRSNLQPISLSLQVHDTYDSAGLLDITYEVTTNDVDQVLNKECVLTASSAYTQLYDEYYELMRMTFINPWWA